MQGVWQLTTPRQLFDKLTRDLEHMREAPHDADRAFNFFVTAETLVDWLYPGNKAAQKSLRTSHVLLQVASHIASGAKHYDKLFPHHQSVHATHLAGTPPALLMYSLSTFPNHPIAPLHLRVTLDGMAAAKLGDSIEAVELAALVHDYWSQPGNIPQ